MIDRREVHFCIRRQTLLGAGVVSLAAFSALPIGAALCYLAGGAAAVACWVVLAGLAVVAVAGIVAGLVLLLAGTGGGEAEAGGAGFLLLLVGGVAGALFYHCRQSLLDAASSALATCAAAGDFVFRDVFVAYDLHVWTWSVLAAALLAAASVGATILVLLAAGGAYRRLARVRFACPRCFHRGLPGFRCPHCCGVVHGLRPSAFGVFAARCGHCHGTLPTLDRLGRLGLRKTCARCSASLNFPGIGSAKELHVAVVGAALSGKSTWLSAAVGQLRQRLPASRVRLTRVADGLFNEPSVLSFQRDGHRGRLVYLYQPSAAEGETEHGLAGRGFPAHVEGIVLVIDPWGEPAILRRFPNRRAGVAGGATGEVSPDALSVLGRLIVSLERAMGLAPTARIPLPIAVVWTKADTLHAHDEGLQLGSGVEVRQFLTKAAGLHNFVGVIESRFSRAGYFVASAGARPADAHAPLTWLVPGVCAGPRTGRSKDSPPVRPGR